MNDDFTFHFFLQHSLEFLTFTLAQPDSATLSTTGQCITDSFTVSGSANIVPAICGSNANQHSKSPNYYTIKFTSNVSLSNSICKSRPWDEYGDPQHHHIGNQYVSLLEHQSHPGLDGLIINYTKNKMAIIILIYLSNNRRFHKTQITPVSVKLIGSFVCSITTFIICN